MTADMGLRQTKGDDLSAFVAWEVLTSLCCFTSVEKLLPLSFSWKAIHSRALRDMTRLLRDVCESVCASKNSFLYSQVRMLRLR